MTCDAAAAAATAASNCGALPHNGEDPHQISMIDIKYGCDHYCGVSFDDDDAHEATLLPPSGASGCIHDFTVSVLKLLAAQ